MKSKMKTKLWPTAKALLVLTMLTVFPSVLCASDDYSISGATTIYDFSSTDDAEAFDIYPFASSAGVEIADGVLRIANDQQYKVIFPSEAPLSDEFMVSVDMKGRMSVISGGLYLFVSSPKDAGDFLNAYDIHVKHNAATET